MVNHKITELPAPGNSPISLFFWMNVIKKSTPSECGFLTRLQMKFSRFFLNSCLDGHIASFFESEVQLKPVTRF